MTVRINEAALRSMYAEVGAKIEAAVNEVAHETADLSLDDAVFALHSHLEGIGVDQSLEWCQNILENLRAGKPVEIRLS